VHATAGIKLALVQVGLAPDTTFPDGLRRARLPE
jgi:hypothetical protein